MYLAVILLVFSGTPLKIDQNKSQNRSIDKVQNLGIKGVKYAKTLAKIQASAIFHIQDIRRNVLPKFKEIFMDTSGWCPSGWAPTKRPEINRNICY